MTAVSYNTGGFIKAVTYAHRDVHDGGVIRRVLKDPLTVSRIFNRVKKLGWWH